MCSQKKRHPILLAIMVFIGVVAIVGGSRSAKSHSVGQISKTGLNAETRTATMDSMGNAFNGFLLGLLGDEDDD